MKAASMAVAASRSAITPSRSGWMTSTPWGALPVSASASRPTATVRPVARSTAIAEGSSTTSPRPRTLTRVLTVPRSIATPARSRIMPACSVAKSLPGYREPGHLWFPPYPQLSVSITAGTSTLAAHNHDRAVRVVHDLAADRADQQPGEAARAPGPDDQQVGGAGRLDQLLSRKAGNGAHRHRGRLGLTELAGRLQRQFLRVLLRLLQVGLVLREQDGAAGPAAGRNRVDGDDGDRSVPERRLLHGPFQRVCGVGRSVDADGDTRHLLPPSAEAAAPGSPNSASTLVPPWYRDQGPSGTSVDR